MKHFKRIILWGLLSLSIQFIGFFYINNYYLAKGTSNMKIKKVEKKEEKKSNVDILVPEESQNVAVSFTGKYLAYNDEKAIDVINTLTGEKKKVEAEKGCTITYYTWLSNQNRMLIGEKMPSGNGGTVLKLTYYDAGKNEKGEIADNDGERVNLAKVNADSSIKNIATSLTNTTYVKSIQTGNRSSLYRVNIMHDINKVETRSHIIGNIKVLTREDNLLYEDITYKKIYSTEIKNPIEIPGIKNPNILGVDNEDTIYIGDKEGEKIKTIVYGNLKDSPGSWSKISLINPVNKEDINVTGDGKVYINAKLEGILKDAISGEELKYEGRFLQIYKGGIASSSQGKLVKTKID